MFTVRKTAEVEKKAEIKPIEEKELHQDCYRAIGYDQHKNFFNETIIPCISNNVMDLKQLEYIVDYRKKIIASAQLWIDVSRQEGADQSVKYTDLCVSDLMETGRKELNNIKIEIERYVIKSETTISPQRKL